MLKRCKPYDLPISEYSEVGDRWNSGQRFEASMVWMNAMRCHTEIMRGMVRHYSDPYRTHFKSLLDEWLRVEESPSSDDIVMQFDRAVAWYRCRVGLGTMLSPTREFDHNELPVEELAQYVVATFSPSFLIFRMPGLTDDEINKIKASYVLRVSSNPDFCEHTPVLYLLGAIASLVEFYQVYESRKELVV